MNINLFPMKDSSVEKQNDANIDDEMKLNLSLWFFGLNQPTAANEAQNNSARSC